MRTKLTQAYLKEALHYDTETGIFTWLTRPVSHFKNSHECNNCNSRLANTKAGSVNKDDGYLRIKLKPKLYFAHRLAFLYMEGYLPENDVDHIDRNRANNKWSNLREVSTRCNLQNCNLSKNNTYGVNGITWHKRADKWMSQIMINSKSKYLGLFDDFDEAVLARYNEEVNNPLWMCSVDSTAFKYLKDRNLI